MISNKVPINTATVYPLFQSANSNIEDKFNKNLPNNVALPAMVTPSVERVTNPLFTYSDDVRRALITPTDNNKHIVRDQLCNYCDDLHDCIKDPIEEYNTIHDSNLLYINITGEQALTINSLNNVRRVEFEDDIQQNVRLAVDRTLYPIIGKNTQGTVTSELINISQEFYQPIVTDNGTYFVAISSFYNADELANYCRPLSSYVGTNVSNYGLYVHDSPFTRNTSTLPYISGFSLSSQNIGENVDVILVDSGIDPNHPEFLDSIGNSRVIQQDWTVFRDDSNNQILTSQSPYYYRDNDGHGTFCASIIGGNTCGWAPGCNIYSIKSITSEDTGITITQGLKLIKAFIKYKQSQGINRPTIINNSWGYGGTLAMKNCLQDINTSTIIDGEDWQGRNAGFRNLVSYSINSLVDEIINVGGIMVMASGNNNDYVIPVKDQIERNYFYLKLGNSFTDIGSIDNLTVLDNAKSVLPLSTYFVGGIQPGMCPNTLSATTTQKESPAIIVGCVYPEDSFGYVHKNHLINEKSGCLNRGVGELFIKSQYSNYGEGVDLFACGYNTLGAIASGGSLAFYNKLNDKIGVSSGTSFACPQVVGCLTNFLNDNLSATFRDCKDWLYNNSLSGRIAEFDNSNVEISTRALFYGSNVTTNLTSYKLPTLKNHNDYFDEVYKAEGYSNVTILNTITAVNEPWVYEWSVNACYCEEDDLIFLPVKHIYNLYLPWEYKAYTSAFTLSTFANPDTVGLNWRNLYDNTLSYGGNLNDIKYMSLCLEYKPFIDTYALQHPNFVGNQINVYKKTSTSVIYLTSITHPYNATQDPNMMPKKLVYNSYNESYFDRTLQDKPSQSYLGALQGARFIQEWTNTNQYMYNLINYKNNKLIIGDYNTDYIYIYNRDSDTNFTLVQVISSVELQPGVIDTFKCNIPLTAIRHSDTLYGNNRRFAGRFGLSDNADYLAIPLKGYTLQSYANLNYSLTGVQDGVQVMDDISSVVFIYKYINAEYQLLSTIQPTIQLSSAYIPSGGLYANYYGKYMDTKSINCYWYNNKLVTISHAYSEVINITLSSSNAVFSVPYYVPRNGNYIETYNIANSTVAYLSTYKPRSLYFAASAVNSKFMCGSAFSDYWYQFAGLDGYELCSTDNILPKVGMGHYSGYYLDNGNLVACNAGPRPQLNFVTNYNGCSPGFLVDIISPQISPIYNTNVLTTKADNNNINSKIVIENNQLVETEIDFNNRSEVGNKVNTLANQEVYEDNYGYSTTIFSSHSSYWAKGIIHATTHNSSGNIVRVEDSTGKVYFSVPDNTNPTGYKTFTLIHGWHNQYPFSGDRYPHASWVNLPGAFHSYINNFHGSMPLRAFFHEDSSTFSVLYVSQSLPDDNEKMNINFKPARFVTFKINSLDFEDGDCNLTEQHVKYNKNIFLNGHNIYDSPNLVLQSYPRKYIITSGDADNIIYDNRVYKKANYSKYPVSLSQDSLTNPSYEFVSFNSPALDYIYNTNSASTTVITPDITSHEITIP